MNQILILIAISLLAIFNVAPHWSILAGISLAFSLKLSANEKSLVKKWSARILQGSIILLGSGLNFQSVINQGPGGLATTFISLTLVILVGEILARTFKVPGPISTLISVGTAICGGSAIGAISPVIKADNLSIAVSMGIVFILNAIAVFTFPPIGHSLGLTQEQFGIWSALAIHDTSAVVAASSLFGDEALALATTLKLTRALWIIPLVLFFTFVRKSQAKITYPWFILLFVAMSLIFTWIIELNVLIPHLKLVARTGFSVTLFLIGLSLNPEQLRTIELKTIGFGLTLWLLTLTSSLIYVYYFIKGKV